MSPEELNVYVAKLREERRNKLKARKHKYYENWKAKHPNSWRDIKLNGYRADKRIMRNWHLKNSYGITLEEKETMIEKQNNCCPICGTTPSNARGWHLDHCHSTKKVRDPLCHACNSMLGYARDDVSILLRGIYYLDRHNKLTGDKNHGNEVPN